MKLKKHIFTILLVVLLFLLIGSVSATDINTNDTQTVSASGNDEILSVGNDVDILGAGEYNYTYLRQQINSGGDITLIKGNYTYADGDGETIEITNSGVIDGNGAVIDMAGLGHRAFYVTASGVTIKNLTIKNANYNGDGGAIYFSQSGTVENCNFTANQATGDYSWGGAVFFLRDGSVTNCNFTANQATGDYSWGGAVFFLRDGSVTNCNFTNNTATMSGGAIRFDGDGSVTNCNFTNNKADNGGAIYFIGTVMGNVTNCNFTDNKATSGSGGSIFMLRGDVENCNFTNNTATMSGGAIVTSNAAVTNCNFTDNSATDEGGAIYFGDEGTVTNCNFTANQVTGDNGVGGAVYFSDNGDVTNCNFINNNADDGGAVYIGYHGEVTNCNFVNNTATQNGGAVYFADDSTGSVINCNFTNNFASWGGGAVYFDYDGTVTNCNFTANQATIGGAVYFTGTGDVRNCNFTDNSAGEWGGAIMFASTGTVTNCNFTNNKATGTDSWGGAILMFSGTVTNCNFTGNTATKSGGAIRMSSGSVSNCNFTGNNATAGSAIYFSTSATKTVSNSRFLNNRANAEALEITKNDNNITINFTGRNNLLNAIYSSNDAEVTFTNVTYWGAKGIATVSATMSGSNKAAGQNITVGVVVNGEIVLNQVNVTNEDGTIVLNINAGENYYITARHDTDSYYTEAEKAISNNTKFNVNVTSQTTNNKTVNITAKSNIPNEVIKGKLLFILPNSTEINANYTANGTWWALHTFDDVGDYNISASYIGLDDVIINNGNISIRYEARVDVNNKTLNLEIGQNFTIVATTTPEGLDVTYVQDDSGVYIVDENGVVTALKNGTGSVFVKIGGDGIYAKNSTIVNVTVSKVPTEISVLNDTLDLKVDGVVETGATLTPADAGNLTYTVSNPSIVKVENGKITALKEGNATITVSFAGNKKYLAAENKTINVTVRLNDASVKVNNNTLNLLVEDKFNLIATTEPKDLTVNFTSNNPSVVTVDNKGNVLAVGEGNATITVTVGGDGKYVENSTTVTVTVSKVPTEITVDPASLDLFVGDETVIAANLTPSDAGNVTFTSSDENIVTVDDKGNVIAEGKGQAIITVSFAGDNKYAAAENKTITVTVSLNDASVTVDNNTLDLKVDETYKINATKHPDTILLDITYTSSDESVATVDKNGVVTAHGEGTAIITLEVGDDEIYAKNSTAVTVTVSKIPTEINIENANVTLNVGDEVSTGAALNPEKAGNLTYKSDDESIAIVKDGKIIALKEGDAIITVSFAGDNKYAVADNKTIKVTVKKLNPIMDVSAEEITEGENATISVTLPDDATGNVTTTVNGKTYFSPVENGNAIIIIPDLEYGSYTIPVTYSGDDKYNPLTKDVNLTVKEDEIIVSALDLTKYYSGTEPFTVNVTYTNGRAIAGKEVKITINGITYTRTTDKNGTVSLNINLNAGTYDVAVEVDNISVDYMVTVLSTINASDIESKIKNLVFTASFIDGEGNYLTDGTNVSFNIKGVIYDSQVTGDKGLASINLTLDSGRYIITSYNPVSDEYASNSIAVDLKDVVMTLSSDEITVGENAIISVSLPDDAEGNVTATVNGKTYANNVNNGKANIIIPDLAAGNYTVPVIYSGDDKYNGTKGDANVTVNKADAAISIDAPPITEGDNATVTVTLPGDATGKVTVGNEIVTVKEGTASVVLTGLKAGITTVPVTYSGDDKYNPIETSVEVIVNEKPVPAKENLTIQATADEITEGENATVIITGLENATGNVSLIVNDKTYTAPVNNGEAVITVPGLTENVTAVINYPGDDKYNSAVTTVNITVNRNTVTITADNLTKYYRDSQKFTVKVTDAKGQAAANKTVEITINGVTYKRTTDENGTAGLNINLNSGEYPVSVAVDDVTVNSTVTVMSTIDASDVVKMFRNDTQYNAIFTDVNGTALANITVSFNINGIIYNRTTDAKGGAKLNINLNAGDYIVTAFNPVTGEMKSNTIKVISLIESDDLTKYYRNASQFVVRIHSADGGYVGAGEEVKFNINGVFYTRTTNATGHAKLNINLGQGNYTVTTYYKDCGRGNNIEVLPILSADDLVMKYRDGSQFKAKLVDGQGKAYAGQNVQFNINGVFYNRATDSTGTAKLNINLMPGEYIITSSYNGSSIANKITVRS